MKEESLLDTREGPDAEEAAMRYLEDSYGDLLRVIQKSKALPPPGALSQLGRIDALTSPFETSQQVRLFVQIAADNLKQVQRILKNQLPIYPLYSMIRSAIEVSSLGLWILDAEGEQKVAYRTLRLYRQNITLDQILWSTLMDRAPDSHDDLLTQLSLAKDRLTGMREVTLDHAVKSTDIIKEVDARHPARSSSIVVLLNGLDVWRACSAFAHGNPISLLNLTERHPEGELGESVTRTSSLTLVVALFLTAVHRAKTLIERYEQMSQAKKTANTPKCQ